MAVQGAATGVHWNGTAGFRELARVGDGLYRARLPVSAVIFNYQPGDLRNTAGFIEVFTGAQVQQVPVSVNVRDPAIPTVQRLSLAPQVQATSHVVNIRYDSIFLDGEVPPSVIRTLYQFFPDHFDFISVLGQVQSPHPLFYLAVRNNIRGLGLQTFARAETYGTTNLSGILHFPDDAFFDPAETSVLHELSHRWMQFSNQPGLRDRRPHFPISTLAIGITGFDGEDPVTGEPYVFRWQLTPEPNGAYRVTRMPDRPRTYNDLELYLMGLLPPDSVGTHVVFTNQNQLNELRHNGLLAGPTEVVEAETWIAREGARDPAYPNTQRSFRMATVVLSRGRLLTPQELSFYHALALRAESRDPLPAIRLTTRFTTLPFYLATGGRAELVTRLQPSS